MNPDFNCSCRRLEKDRRVQALHFSQMLSICLPSILKDGKAKAVAMKQVDNRLFWKVEGQRRAGYVPAAGFHFSPGSDSAHRFINQF